MQWIYPNSELIALIASTRTLFATSLMKLTKAQIALSRTTVLADLTAVEADFTGYAAITLAAVGTSFFDGVRGGVSFSVPTQQWTVGAAPVTPNTVYGGWFESAAGALLLAWQIQDGYPMVATNDSLNLETLLNFYNSAQSYDAVMSINNVPI